MSRIGLFAALCLGLSLLPGPTLAHTAGQCTTDLASDRCEKWARTFDDPSIKDPARSDQFSTGVASNGNAIFVAVKDVALDPNDPYSAGGSWVVIAYERSTGGELWRSGRRTRVYDMPLAVTTSPDGSRVFVTGAAYDAFPVGATDSRLITVAYDAATGAEAWSAQWDNSPSGVDNGLAIASAPDGSAVYVGGVSRPASGGLDYVILGYDGTDGRQLWQRTYSGVKPASTNALKAVGVSPDGTQVYITGESEGVIREYDNDYLTMAIAAKGENAGSVLWTKRFDGTGTGLSDRAAGLSVATDGTVVVTGDSAVALSGGSVRYDAVTIAYRPDGGVRWEARYIGPYGLEFGTSVGTGGGLLTVTSLGRGADAQSGNDGSVFLYGLAGGAPRWLKRWQDTDTSEIPVTSQVSQDGSIIYTLSNAQPSVQYTSLSQMVIRAYDAPTGLLKWTSEIDAGWWNAVNPRALIALDGGGVAVIGDTVLSQNPLGPPSQNRYDVLTAVVGP